MIRGRQKIFAGPSCGQNVQTTWSPPSTLKVAGTSYVFLKDFLYRFSRILGCPVLVYEARGDVGWIDEILANAHQTEYSQVIIPYRCIQRYKEDRYHLKSDNQCKLCLLKADVQSTSSLYLQIRMVNELIIQIKKTSDTWRRKPEVFKISTKVSFCYVFLLPFI